MKIKCLTLFFILFLLPVLANAARLTEMTIENPESTARIVFTFDHLPNYRIFTLANPNRIVADFDDATSTVNLKKLHFQAKQIKNVRVGHFNKNKLRLVFDTVNPPKLNTSQSKNNKLILDVYPAAKKSAETFFVNTLNTKPQKILTSDIVSRPIVIVIDAGHGGKDPGTIGKLGTKEKEVVLSIAYKLAKLISKEPNMRAVMTRKGDYFVPLASRLKLTRKDKADLFIAIHADSYFNNRSVGASVYALSSHGATSVAARWLANRENHSELGGVDLNGLNDQSVELRSVLIDLAQTATITDSLRLGTEMLDALDDITRLHYARVEQAPFMVLKSPDIPSILVETGFLSNPYEEQRLRSNEYQNKLAAALLDGIQRYIKKYSPTTGV